MTRPQIIRADTIDLQNQTSPTAQDHTRQPTHPAPLGIGPAAPHQAAALHHVHEERASEEEHLRQAWNNDARADPPSDDEQDRQHSLDGDTLYDDQAGQQNGNYGRQHDDQEMADGESDDDDMMDKISSSPSIDDGGYFSHSAMTLEPATPQRDQRPFSTASPSLSVASSPFVDTPQHLPLGAMHRLSLHEEESRKPASSTYATTPVNLRISFQGDRTPSKHHCHGEYAGNTNSNDVPITTKTAPLDRDIARIGPSDDLLVIPKPLERDISVSSLNEEAMGKLLLPADDPLLNQEVDTHEEQGSEETYIDLTDPDDDGWETESDLSSFNSDDYRNDANDIFLTSSTKDSRFVDSGWGGECLQETEDIDFEFVYALHTFVATVEGQANATKGDTMVLLDDSNSYWWLVRIVKDSSIGYLPAEHIETPTERLARLNKHRNIDLSATMLGDTAEKSKNPLKKAMRRRNTRTVQFSSQPIYVEASDYEFSSDEEDGDDSMFGNNEASAQEQQATSETTAVQSDVVEPLATNGRREQDPAADDLERNGRVDEVESRGRGGDQPRPSEDSVIDKQFGPGRSRNGVVRNTDSFFRDETVETRKITLTPNILRDESLGAATNVRVSETRERGASIDSIGRSESSKEDKRRKEKKTGMFSGLFKKKEKKGKGSDDLDEKQSGELSPKLSDDGFQMSPTINSFPTAAQQTPQRAGSKGKLQKTNPKGENSPVLVQAASNEQLRPQKQPSPQEDQAAIESTQPAGITQQASMRMVQTSQEDLRAEQPPSLRIKTQQPEQGEQQQLHPQQQQGQLEQQQQQGEPQTRTSGSLMSGFIDTLRSPDDGQPKREKLKKAKQRVALDDFDSSPDEDRGPDPFGDVNEYRSESGQRRAEAEPSDRLSESPVQVSPVGQTQSLDTEDSSQPPGLVGDTSSQEDHGSSSASSPEFEDVGTEFRRDDTPMQNGSGPYNSGRATAPAPLSIKKQPSVASMDQGHYVPPQPTRAAPTPGVDRSASPQVLQVSGVRSITPTSGPIRQLSMSPLSRQQQQFSSSPPSTTSDSSATPTAASVATPKTPPAQMKSEPQWSDAALRAYMDDTSHVRNLLLLVHDTSGVVPLGPEDSKVQAWYPDERRQLKSLERNLDSLLQGWVDKKRKAKGPRT